MIKDFQDYGTHFSFTVTLQVTDLDIIHIDKVESWENCRIKKSLKNIKLINNSFDKEVNKCYEKEHLHFFKSGKEYSYYHAYTNHKFYLNEHDWNILTGKTKK